MSLRLPAGPRLAQGERPHALRARPFHPGPCRLPLRERWRLLPVASRLEGFGLGLGAEFHRAGAGRGLRTAGPDRARGTIGGSAVAGTHGLAAAWVVRAGGPPTTDLPPGTGDRVGRPITRKAGHSIARGAPGWPTAVWQHGPPQIERRAVTAGPQRLRIDISGIHHVFAGQQVLGREMAMNDRRHLHVSGRRRRRLDIGEQVGARLVTGLGELDLIPCPGGFPLRGLARLRSVGRTTEQGRGREIRGGTPAPLGGRHVIRLEPDPA